MIILHGSWLSDAWLLWGERDGCAPHPTAHNILPWGCTSGELAAVLQAIVGAPPNPEVEDNAGAGYFAWLPAINATVLPSQPWRRRHKSVPTLQPRSVCALKLTPLALLALLGKVANRQRLGRGLLAGHDLEAWSDLLRYAGALVARRQFLPDLSPCGNPDTATSWEAWWRPALDRAEQRRLEELAAQLPRAALCLTADPAQPPSWRAQPEAATAFLNEIMDRLVRLATETTLTRAHAAHGHFNSAHDAWCAALRGPNRVVRWSHATDLAALAQSIANWRRPLDRERRARQQLRLELIAPADAGATWHLQCLVATNGAPENCRTWKEMWHDPRTSAAERAGLLVALGQATLITPLLNEARDGVVAMNVSAAHRFMRLETPVLLAAGFVVKLPEWWQPGSRQIELVARVGGATINGTALFSRNSLLEVDWQLALGGEPVSVAELTQLAESGQELVRFRNRWLAVEPGEINAALRLWEQQKGKARTTNDIVRLLLGMDRAQGVALHGLSRDGRLTTLLAQLRGAQIPPPVALPVGFTGVLRPYQEVGYAWLAFLRHWGLGACLADDMGLGKTIQALALLAHEREQGEQRPALLVCPTSVLTNWRREAARFVPALRIYVHHGPARSVGGSFVTDAAAAALVVTSYHLLYRDYASLRQIAWAGIILDEAQNIKNPDTRQAQAARALASDYRIALTGTPLENQVGDLWSIMDFLNPGLLGGRAEFRDTFTVPIKTGYDPAAAERLRQITAPFMLRRLKTDRKIIGDLPEKHEARVYCALTHEQATLYQGVLDGLDAALQEKHTTLKRRGLVLAAITHLKQICNHPAHYLGEELPLGNRSGKLARLRDMLEEVVANGEAALVFTQYARMGALLQRHLQQEFACFVPFLHGGTPRNLRDDQISTFQEQPGPAIFVLSLKAGGTGLNLTRANHVFHFDRWWNPAVENQATDRAFRIGQTRDVMVHAFVCAGTLEERVDAMLTGKAALAEKIVASGETWLAELGNDDLREALALAHDTLGDFET